LEAYPRKMSRFKGFRVGRKAKKAGLMSKEFVDENQLKLFD
jgi:hypothetical protein